LTRHFVKLFAGSLVLRLASKTHIRLLLPGLALEAMPGLGVLPFWLLVVGAIAVLGTPRPKFEGR